MLEFIKKSLIAMYNFAYANRLKVGIAVAAVLACAFFPPLAFVIPTIAAFLTFLGPAAIPTAFAAVGLGAFMATSIVDYTGSALIHFLNKCCCPPKSPSGEDAFASLGGSNNSNKGAPDGRSEAPIFNPPTGKNNPFRVIKFASESNNDNRSNIDNIDDSDHSLSQRRGYGNN